MISMSMLVMTSVLLLAYNIFYTEFQLIFRNYCDGKIIPTDASHI